jgi:ATP-binding cassette subfamily F protein 3
LLLDEPTNNLDIASAEVLEDALDDYTGTLLIISHDRYFLDRVVNRIVELEDGSLKEYLGNYTYYKEQKESQRGNEGTRRRGDEGNKGKAGRAGGIVERAKKR